MSMIINDKRQRYYGEIKARFYLRRPTASGLKLRHNENGTTMD